MLFKTHNTSGSFGREKQYGDTVAELLYLSGVQFQRECAIGGSGNIADFIVDSKIVLELKAKRFLIQEDFDQVQRYLQESQLLLGVVVNFRAQY